MKKITFILLCITFLGYSQNNVSVDESNITRGYINAFNISDGTFAFGFDYNDLPTLKATFPTSTSISLAPNFQIWDNNDATPCGESFCSMWNPDWFSSPMVPNKDVELNAFAEDNSLAGSDLNFSGTVTANTLDAGYSAIAFIKTLDPNNGFATVTNNTVVLPASGDFTVSASAAELQSGFIIQYGYSVFGVIADPAQEPALGTIDIDQLVLSTNSFDLEDFTVSPNPTNNVWNVRTNNQNITSVAVFDLLGKEVIRIEPNATEANIDASGFADGIYLAKIASNNGTKTIKLVKE
ncbi:T9SS type A sorting domain-containing protein [Winogradskyella ursingii]|uniref:T9SS type A sorting domain-containing protein n=1 Tax=Winogradskyella ursingii TaxID=2686079 RepID=UPI0015C7D3D2|nr:T9SS type A sorting domain-containing protein [Winogradskyella ursingii]